MPDLFVSYARTDSEFALRLAADLKAAGVVTWIDQFDIQPSQRWDRAIEEALAAAPRFLIILSPAAVASENVLDEINYALEEKKQIIPVMYQQCNTPFRLRRIQRADFAVQGYEAGLGQLLQLLGAAKPAPVGDGAATPTHVPRPGRDRQRASS